MGNDFKKLFVEPQNCSLRHHFNVVDKVNKLYGLHLYRKEKKPILENLYLIFTYVTAIISLFSAPCCFLRESTMDEKIDAVLVTIVAWQVLPRSFILIFNKKYHNLFRDEAIKNSEELDKTMSRNHDLGMKYAKLANKIIRLVIGVYVITAIACILHPFMSSKEWLLPAQITIVGIPFKSHPGYEINYVILSVEICYIALCYLGFDLAFYLFSVYICSRLELCSRYFSMLGNAESEFNTKQKQKQLLHKCAKIHTGIYTLANQCMGAFSLLILIQACSSVGIICICFFHLRVHFIINSLAFLITTATQMFMFSLCGQSVVTKSREASQAIYNSQWYNLTDTSDRKMVLTMLANSQFDITFSIGGFGQLSMETFTEVMKSSYSICTFLVSML